MNVNIVTALLIGVLVIAAVQANLNVLTQEDSVPSAPLPSNGAAVDEVVVESSLYIKPKLNPKARKTRSVPDVLTAAFNSLVEHKRVKRRFDVKPQWGPYGAHSLK